MPVERPPGHQRLPEYYFPIVTWYHHNRRTEILIFNKGCNITTDDARANTHFKRIAFDEARSNVPPDDTTPDDESEVNSIGLSHPAVEHGEKQRSVAVQPPQTLQRASLLQHQQRMCQLCFLPKPTFNHREVPNDLHQAGKTRTQ